jgi:hypothetical protein
MLVTLTKAMEGNATLKADMEWVDNKCYSMLNEYAEDFDVLKEGECLLRLSEWTIFQLKNGIVLLDAFGIEEEDEV